MTIKINGEVLPEVAIQYELERLVKFYSEHVSPEELQSQADILKKRAREQAIGAKLLINETSRLDIKVPAEEIDQRLEAMVKNAGGKAAFARLLKESSSDEAAIRKSIEQGRRVDILVERITQVVPEPTEDEIFQHFKKHSAEYRRPERVQARHILVRFEPGSEADRQTSMSRANEIRQKVRDGADFADQAAAHSDCPSGKKARGNLGWISRGMTLPEFDRVVFSMKIGELSEVLETPLGFHIINKLAHEQAHEAEFDEVRENIRDFLRHSYRGEALTAYVNELKAKSVIEED